MQVVGVVSSVIQLGSGDVTADVKSVMNSMKHSNPAAALKKLAQASLIRDDSKPK